ncbi:unnamed protein product [Ilex paraguariensis]|uniref:Uncharacterized protein n=1 Tax=Ilex paraguariensis TaxID=185542 RepID=A0ABC8UZC8_9AQUA
MGSKPMSPMKTGVRRTKRRPNSRRRFCRPQKSSRRVVNGGPEPCSSLADKLEVLKNLIPSYNQSGDMKADKLFEETADYIVLLRTQVSVLQKLVDFYGSSHEIQNPV